MFHIFPTGRVIATGLSSGLAYTVSMGAAFTAEGVEQEHKRQCQRYADELKANGRPCDDSAFWMGVIQGKLRLQTEHPEETAARRRKLLKASVVVVGVSVGATAIIWFLDKKRVAGVV